MTDNKLIHLKNTSSIELSKLVEGNVTYSVLRRILKKNCTDIFHNSESVIICYSNPPYPIWVWCKDANDACDIANIAECIKKCYPLEEDYNIIMSYDVLERLKKYDGYFANAMIKTELLSYQLKTLNNINRPCDARAVLARADDLNVLAPMFKDMHYEMEKLTFDIETCKETVLELIGANQLYTLRNPEGKIVAVASKKIEGSYGRISTVYTLPSERRKGYAINLVHAISKELLSEGITPILYTDGAYIASNECYKKIGFELIGRICNIKKQAFKFEVTE